MGLAYPVCKSLSINFPRLNGIILNQREHEIMQRKRKYFRIVHLHKLIKYANLNLCFKVLIVNLTAVITCSME